MAPTFALGLQRIPTEYSIYHILFNALFAVIFRSFHHILFVKDIFLRRFVMGKFKRLSISFDKSHSELEYGSDKYFFVEDL